MGKDKYGDIAKEKLEKELEKTAGEEKTTVYEFNEDKLYVKFNETNRMYSVDKDGNIEEDNSSITKPDTTPGEFDGTGSDKDPYVIMSIEDLVALSKNVSEGEKYTNRTFKLGKSLSFTFDASYVDPMTTQYNEYLGIDDSSVGLKEALTNKKYSGFKPIGTDLDNYTYAMNAKDFDGDNNSIEQLYINTNGRAGLFGNAAAVSNLKLTGTVISTGDYAGGLGGKTISYVKNCTINVNVQSEGSHTGGIVGGYVKAENCINYGTVNGKYQVGGIAGGIGGTMTNCKNYGNVTGKNTVGGIAGQQGWAINCINYGKVVATEHRAGGINGNNGGQRIDKCINYGEIIAPDYVGGIVGNGGRITNSINKGKVTGTKTENSYVGGISGIFNDIPIENCLNEGELNGRQLTGGIVGGMPFTQSENSKIVNCFNIGKVTGKEYVGEIAGGKDGYGTHYVQKCYGIEGRNELFGGMKSRPGRGFIEIDENSKLYSEEYVKKQEFLDILNNYVDEYNAGDKSETGEIELVKWEFDSKTGYPTLVLDIN